MTPLEVFQLLVVAYFVGVNGLYTVLTAVAWMEIRRQRLRTGIDDRAHMLRSELLPGVSILVPCYNEEPTIVDSVHSLLASKYADLEIVVVNDGSKDATFERLAEAFRLRKVPRVLRRTIDTQPVRGVYVSSMDGRLLVIDKANGGKADSLNAGLNACTKPYFVSIDADVILEDDAILRIIKPFMDDADMVAGGGIVRLVNSCAVERGQVVRPGMPRHGIEMFQMIEYFRAFTAGRAGMSRLGSLLMVSGAFGVFDAELVRGIGGYDRSTVGEDLEVLVRLHRHLRRQRRPYRVFFAAHPICWTEAPDSARLLGRQRSRWQRGLSEAMWKHRSMILNPRYGRIGLFSMPAYVVFEWLGPLVEAAGYGYIVFLALTEGIHTPMFLLLLVLAVYWGMALSLASIALQVVEFDWHQRWGSMLRLMFYSLAENVGYRQLTVFWRVRGIAAWLTKRSGWGEMPRKGFDTGPS